eukprot:2227530-Amphidinium_carterae.1
MLLGIAEAATQHALLPSELFNHEAIVNPPKWLTWVLSSSESVNGVPQEMADTLLSRGDKAGALQSMKAHMRFYNATASVEEWIRCHATESRIARL